MTPQVTDGHCNPRPSTIPAPAKMLLLMPARQKVSTAKKAPKGSSVGTGATGRSRGPAPAAAPRTPKKTTRYDPLGPERLAEILSRLDQLYPAVTCALTHANAWELLVATILSAQSTDVNVNRVTPELFRKYPTVQAFAALSPEQLEPDVRSTGFFRNKSLPTLAARFRTTWKNSSPSPA